MALPAGGVPPPAAAESSSSSSSTAAAPASTNEVPRKRPLLREDSESSQVDDLPATAPLGDGLAGNLIGDFDECSAHLVYTGTRDAGNAVELPPVVHLTAKQPVVHIGRSKECELLLDSTTRKQLISRQHALLSCIGTQADGLIGWRLEDLKSVNGVFVNDVRTSRADLADGDVVTFGGGAMVSVGQRKPQINAEFSYTFRRHTPSIGGGGGGGSQEKRLRLTDEQAQAAAPPSPPPPPPPAAPLNDEHVRRLEAEIAQLKHKALEKADVEDELTCAICNELLHQAVTLECSHTFCRDCIEEWRRRTLACALCRKSIHKDPIRQLNLDNLVDKLLLKLTPSERQEREERVNRPRSDEDSEWALLQKALDKARDQGTTFLKIADRWEAPDRSTFQDGVARYRFSRARVLYCSTIGLDEHFIASSPLPQLRVAAQNLAIPGAMQLSIVDLRRALSNYLKTPAKPK